VSILLNSRNASVIIIVVCLGLSSVITQAFADTLKNPKSKTYFFSSIGYDNNADLNSERQGEVFQGLGFDYYYAFPYKKWFDFKFHYGVDAKLYNENDRNSFVYQEVKTTLEKRLGRKVILRLGYELEPVVYFEGKQDYVKNKLFASTRHYLTKKLFYETKYEFSYRNFSDRRARQGTGGDSEKKRQDIAHEAQGKFGYLLSNSTLVQIAYLYKFNDSNDSYLDYYDYISNGVRFSLLHYFISRKLYCVLSLTYRSRIYDSRLITSDSIRQEDDNYMGHVSLNYYLNKKTSLIAQYSYLQNTSNEPSYKYSDSVVSLGLKYSF